MFGALTICEENRFEMDGPFQVYSGKTKLSVVSLLSL